MVLDARPARPTIQVPDPWNIQGRSPGETGATTGERRTRGAYNPRVSERTTHEGPRWANPHDRLDEIRRRTHVAIATKIDADPALLDVPRRNIHRWAEHMGRMPSAYAEWLETLDRPWPEIRHILVSPDENSVRMRQSTPFSGILSQRERLTIRGTVGA